MKFIKLILIICLLSINVQCKRNKILNGFKNQKKDKEQVAPKMKLNIDFIKKVDHEKPQLMLEQHHTSDYMKDDTKLDINQKCLIKQGYLAYITNIQDASHSLRGLPVFGVLNSHNIALFENENVNSLVSTVELQEISQMFVPAIWQKHNHYCFQILGGKFDKDDFLKQSEDEPEQKARMTLCLLNRQQMISWMQSLKDLRINCQQPKKEVEIQNNKIKQQRIIVDDQLAKYTSSAIDQNQQSNQEDSLLKEKERQKQLMIKKKFDEIMKQNNQASINQSSQITIIEEERRKIDEKTTLIQEQKECLEEMLSTKREEEIKITQILITEEEEQTDSNLINSAKDKIQSAKEKELAEIKEQEEELKKEALKKQNDIKMSIIKDIQDAGRSLDPKLCYSDDLKTSPESAMKTACGKLVYPGTVPDIKKIQRCLYKPNFCNECCSHFIGINHAMARGNCKMVCRGKVFPETYQEFQYDYVLKIPRHNVISERMNTTNATNATNTDNNNLENNKLEKIEEEADGPVDPKSFRQQFRFNKAENQFDDFQL